MLLIDTSRIVSNSQFYKIVYIAQERDNNEIKGILLTFYVCNKIQKTKP